MIKKLFSNLANRLDPKFMIYHNGKKEKYNSVMALKTRLRQLEKQGHTPKGRERG